MNKHIITCNSARNVGWLQRGMLAGRDGQKTSRSQTNTPGGPIEIT